MADLIDDYKSLIQSDAFGFEMRLSVLDSNFYIFNTNHSELRKILQISNDTKLVLKILGPDNHDALDRVLLELTRRLQNFLLSAIWLRDTTKDLINTWYSSEAFINSYREKEQSYFGGIGLHDFVKDLRHYFTHRGRPAVFSNYSIGQNPGVLKHMFTVKKEYLLHDWTKWGAKTKIFLENLPEDIEIKKIVGVYYDEIKTFHDWLFTSIQTLHRSELEWLASEKKRLRELAGPSPA